MSIKEVLQLNYAHVNIPDEDYEDFVDGWDHSYFAALIEFYEEE